MYSPKRQRLNNMVNGYNKKRNENVEEDCESYPPTSMARDGVSPYFIGKPRRKKPAEKPPCIDTTSPPPPFQMRDSTEEEDEEILIEEDEIIDVTPEKRPPQRSIQTFFPKKPDENATRKKINDLTLSPEKSVTSSSVLPKVFDRRNSDESAIIPGVKRNKNFNFSADPKVNRIRDRICEIADPSGEKGKNTEFTHKMQEKAAKSIELVATEPHKRSRKLPKNPAVTASTLGTVYPSFTTANGQDVHKNKFVNPLSENEKVTKTKTIDCSRQSSSVSTNGVIPDLKRKVSAPPFLKKAMGMETDGGGKDEVIEGLRAEPSLKNFDENIISLIESEIMSVNTEIGWADVAGLEGAKKALREIVVLPFKRPDVFTGIRAPPKGVLLFGPPGTGKTMIGRCVASQCHATFFNISASSLTSKWVGEGEKLVRALFAVARLKLPSVIFIDEVDSLLSARSESEHESSRRIKTEFLVQLDGVNTAPDERLLVLGATNRPQELDEAARRRFQKRLYIALPEPESRTQIVQNLLRETHNQISESCLKRISEVTEGYSGADMRQLCTEAAMGPIRDIGDEIETIDKDDIRAVNLQDFIEASQVVRPTVDDSQLDAYSSWDKKFGCLPPPR